MNKKNLLNIGSFKKYNFILIVSSVCSNIFLFIISYNISNIIDLFASNHNVLLDIVMTLVYTGLFILTNFIDSYIFKLFSIKISIASYSNSVKYLLNKNLDFFDNNSSADLQNDVFNIAESINSYDKTKCILIITHCISIITFLVIVISNSFILGLLIAVLTLLLGICSSALSKKVAKEQSNFMVNNAKLGEGFLEVVDNISLIKNLSKESYFFSKQEKIYYKNYSIPGKRYSLFMSLYLTLHSLLTFGFPLIVLITGFLLTSNSMITMGSAIAVYSITGQLQEPIRNLFGLIAGAQICKENFKKVEYLFEDIKPQLKMKEGFKTLSIFSKGFKYDDNILLKDLSLTVTNGDFILLRGPSGCGKTTLFKFLTKKIISENIHVTIDDIEINSLEINIIMAQVSQNTYILHGSILENITLGNDYTQDHLKEILEVCCIDEMLEKYPIDKIIDYQNSNLSGGEKQRISLARVLITKPKILLLDEVTSSLDEQMSFCIANNIKSYCDKYNITVLCISHKNEFDNVATKVIEL